MVDGILYVHVLYVYINIRKLPIEFLLNSLLEGYKNNMVVKTPKLGY